MTCGSVPQKRRVLCHDVIESPGFALTFEDIFHRSGVGEHLDYMFWGFSQVHLSSSNLLFKGFEKVDCLSEEV